MDESELSKLAVNMKHFAITFLLMIFILIVHCPKVKKKNVKKVYIYVKPLTKETYDFLVYLVKIMIIATL